MDLKQVDTTFCKKNAGHFYIMIIDNNLQKTPEKTNTSLLIFFNSLAIYECELADSGAEKSGFLHELKYNTIHSCTDISEPAFICFGIRWN